GPTKRSGHDPAHPTRSALFRSLPSSRWIDPLTVRRPALKSRPAAGVRTERSGHSPDPRITGDQAKNRLLLGEGLERQGFVNYDKEWWHFTFKPADQGESYPDTYFDFPVWD
ncbi:MAG: M15 family metallopeptidase, partial [Mycobacteriaceae bacterium]